MNVTCTGCPAKYAVPDEKVRGKKVRITCKHCGTNIVVDGNALGAGQSVLPQGAPLATASVHQISSMAPKEAAAPKAPAAAPESTFIVGFTDDRQESHSVSQIVDMYGAGKIDDDALVWKDGMADWLSPFDVPEIAAACSTRGVARRSSAAALVAPADDEATVVGHSAFDDAPAPVVAAAPAVVTAPRAKAASSPALGNLKPFTQPAQPVAAANPAAARRVEKRAGSVDLFGGVAEAGSETDNSLDFGTTEEPAHKMTGARNESSVLFSLDALTKPDPKATQKQKARDKEQENEASAALFGESAPNSLLNMSGGLAALAAPDFTQPVMAPQDPVFAAPSLSALTSDPPKKKGGAILLIGSMVIIAAVAGGAFLLIKKQPVAPKPPDAPVATTPTAAPAPIATEAPTARAAPEASAAAAEPSAALAAGGAAPLVPGAKPTAATVNTPATPATVNKPPEPATPTQNAPPPAADGAAFDKGAAVAALGAAAASAGSCKKPDGPTGTGKASVTFAPSGRATATNVSGAFAGTEVGGCVARLFRAAKVPAFSGDAVTVSKSFTIE